MLSRVQRFGSDSDSARFWELLYAGEFILKLTAAAFISTIQDDREGHRYRLLHGLVRADGIGDWARALDEALTGAPSQHIASELSDVRRLFTERVAASSWQGRSANDLHDVLMSLNDSVAPNGDKVALRSWFQDFAQIRNKTRGHGAPTPATCAKLAPKLEASIRCLCDNHPIFQLPWAYLHRNLSGNYKVVELGGDSTAFNSLKTNAASDGANYPDGVYMSVGKYYNIPLLHTDLDVTDFFLPNGAFRNGTFEFRSLITDSHFKGDASPYLAPASERPPSETQGTGELDVLGQVFTNLPDARPGYVRRPKLEDEVRVAFANDRHPIVTLVGRGGIGKTSLAIEILREMASTDRYSVIVWFSARDIDLMSSGAKSVQPRVLTALEIAEEYLALVGSTSGTGGSKVSAVEIMAEHLRKSPLGPTLFVFDNFETVRSPVDLFQWIDNNIRLPNKAVITSRFREFKADYPIEVRGMEPDEAAILVTQTAIQLGIQTLIGPQERSLIIEESEGHPYVIKIMMGEVANAGKFAKPSKLIARKDDILDALFERTYANLSPMAARIFLMLSGWRSLVPQLAVEAVLMRQDDGEGDPEAAIDQLVRMSLIERVTAGDTNDFLRVPLAAALFGLRKLEVSPSRAVIEIDLRFLQDLGATAASGLKDGLHPRVVAFFGKAARRISNGTTSLDELRPVLEFLARGFAPALMLLSELEQEAGGPERTTRAAEYVRRYLETHPNPADAGNAWRRLVSLYSATNDVIGGVGAFLKAAETLEPTLGDISTMAHWLNNAPEAIAGVDLYDRRALFKPLANLLETHIATASATDLSRLAWLHLHSGDTRRAREVTDLGLGREPTNVHCARLADRLADER